MGTVREQRPMTLLVTLAICGAALVLMPQIHSSVVSANVLYATAIRSAHPGELPPELEPTLRSIGSWMSYASIGLGGLCILIAAGSGIMLTLRTLRA